MVLKAVECPRCCGEKIHKIGNSKSGNQRYRCKECTKSFQENYVYNGHNPNTKSAIYFHAVNGSGIRATARILGISTDTVISTLRSFEPYLWFINYAYLEKIGTDEIELGIVSESEIEMDEMWSFVHDKSQQYWLWWAIDHHTGEPLAFHFGTRKHKNLDVLLELLAGFNITKVYSDDNFAYSNRITPDKHEVGKRNTQKIERKHLSLRTWCARLVRKGIRFSKKHDMHRIVIALVINH